MQKSLDKKNIDAENSILQKKQSIKILIDVCCAPCATHVIDAFDADKLAKLKHQSDLVHKGFEIALYFSNDNIYPRQEYIKRKDQAVKLARIFGKKIFLGDYDHRSWLEFIKGFENEKEGGKRCQKCFEYRLDKTAKLAKEKNFDAFTSTLTISPHKNFNKISEIAERIAKKRQVRFLAVDFKKNDGFKKSIALSKKHGLYRQNYCGCEFSIRK